MWGNVGAQDRGARSARLLIVACRRNVHVDPAFTPDGAAPTLLVHSISEQEGQSSG